jgi:prephenate dehydratase
MSHRVAFQGVAGAYSEKAALNFFGRSTLTIPHKSFMEVFSAVGRGKCNFGIVPIENSLAGSIHENYDLCLKNKLWITGEIKLRVSHSLIVNRGVKLAQIRQVYSHPQALSQCAGFIRTKLKKAQPMPYFDTAGSVELLRTSGARNAAAIAGKDAAQKNKMTVLKSGIEDNPENFTRFIILSRKRVQPTPKQKSKSSIVFALKNVPGALHKALSIFALRDIDLVKIESRPLAGSPWKYLFYLDFAGNLKEDRCLRALDHLGEVTTFIRVLGCYPWAD